MNYGPWTVESVIYERKGTSILATTDKDWVIKAVFNQSRWSAELANILKIMGEPPRNCVALSPEPHAMFGALESGGWVAFRRYTDEVSANDFCKTNWRTLAIHVLRFLQDFHHTQRLAHMDIKRANILYNADPCEFVVTDFDLAESTHPAVVQNYSDDTLWYYMAMGAEPDQPLVSWRMDLVSLGYLLGGLVADPKHWSFEQICWNKRTGHSTLSQEEILGIRARQLAWIDPVILEYLKRVATVSWSAEEPPPRSFYEELEALFQ